MPDNNTPEKERTPDSLAMRVAYAKYKQDEKAKGARAIANIMPYRKWAVLNRGRFKQ